MSIKEEVKKLTPSSFTYINQCPCWERKPTPPSDAMLRGTAMDGFLRNYLFHNMESLDGIAHKMLKKKDFVAIEWAGNTIRHACGKEPILCKKTDCRFKFTIGDVLISGEMDTYCPSGKLIFDLKSGGIRDYEMQMLPYAYHGIKSTNSDYMDTRLVFCDFKIMKSKVFSESEATERMEEFVAKWDNPDKVPTKCDACKYCKYLEEEKSKCSLML